MRKHFPEGTFIATPLRILSILQLCVVFTFLAWVGGYPFLGEIYEIKVAKQKYETVFTDSHYVQLPKARKVELQKGYDDLQKRSAVTFIDQLEKSVRILFFDLPHYTKVWVLLSIVLPIFILLRIEGATQVVWVLPILVSCGLFVSFGQNRTLSEEEKLFPTETVLIRDYLGGSLDGRIMKQWEQLQQAWDRYLLKVWLGEEPSPDVDALVKQKEKGQFLFNVARAEAVQRDGFFNRGHSGPGVWILFLLWNLGWAAGITIQGSRKKGRKGQKGRKMS